MRNLHEPTYSFVILTFILIIADMLLAWFSVRLSPAGATGISWIFWAIAGLISVLIPLVAFRTLKVDLLLKNRRDWVLFFLFGVLINNIVGAAWGVLTLSLGNIIKTGEISSIFSTWAIGSFIVTILIVPFSLRYFTPKIRQSKLFVTCYWE
jgi:uncharacterized membrane protein